MLEHTTLDDFVRGLYVNSINNSPFAPKLSKQDKLMQDYIKL